MGNLVEATDIPLAGPGFNPRVHGKYGPGEFRKLTNVEVDLDGNLRYRRRIEAILAVGGGATWPVTTPVKFIGNLNEFAMFVTDLDPSRPYVIARAKPSFSNVPNNRVQLWSGPATTTAHFADLKHAKLVGFHRYNDRNYWVSRLFRSTVAISPMNAMIQVLGYASASDVGNSHDPSYFDSPGGVEPTQRVTVATTTIPGFPDPQSEALRAECEVVKTLMFRDRLWIATERTLYFSKATDPMTWAAPDGGFFRFPNQTITDVVAVGQTLYIICENSIWTLQYTTDPNTNATLTQISQGLGGDSATVYEDVVYFSRNEVLWSCENNRVNKVLDLNFQLQSDVNALGYTLKLVTWNHYIIFLYQVFPLFDPSAPANLGMQLKSNPIPGGYVQGLLPIIWLNMENGAKHQFDFQDQLPMLGAADKWGRINDMMVVPFKDDLDRTLLYAHTTGNTVGGGGPDRGYAYSMLWDQEDVKVSDNSRDLVATSADFFEQRYIPVDIEIDSWTPDTDEFAIKKFRALLIEGDINGNLLLLKLGYGNNPALSAGTNFPPSTAMGGPAMDPLVRPPFPFKIGLNQRARSLTIKLTSTNATVVGNNFKLVINKIKVLWTPTSRLPVGQNVE